jgi:hypothetical protein
MTPRTTVAQEERARTALVGTTEGNVGSDLAAAVDGALLHKLKALAGIENPKVSPVDLAEIQLNVGCEGESRACLSSVAETLQVESLVVRHLSVAATGTLTLRLTRFDAALAQEPLTVQATAAPEMLTEIVEKVPALVRELFGLPEPSAVPAPAPAPAPIASAPNELPDAQRDTRTGPPTDDRSGGTVGAITWVTLAAGVAVLTGGVALGISARSSYDDFKHTPVATREDVHRLSADLDALQTKGTIANVLMPVGGALLGLGATLLILDLTGRDDAKREAKLTMSPSVGGAVLMLHGRFEE